MLRSGAIYFFRLTEQFLLTTWPILNIALVYHGGSGRHLYDVTYHEYFIFNWVGQKTLQDSTLTAPDCKLYKDGVFCRNQFH